MMTWTEIQWAWIDGRITYAEKRALLLDLVDRQRAAHTPARQREIDRYVSAMEIAEYDRIYGID